MLCIAKATSHQICENSLMWGGFYFIGFLFAGINIVGTAILSAVESTKYAFAASISRGFVAIIFFAFILSAIFGLNGVWMAFPFGLTSAGIMLWLRFRYKTKDK